MLTKMDGLQMLPNSRTQKNEKRGEKKNHGNVCGGKKAAVTSQDCLLLWKETCKNVHELLVSRGLKSNQRGPGATLLFGGSACCKRVLPQPATLMPCGAGSDGTLEQVCAPHLL